MISVRMNFEALFFIKSNIPKTSLKFEFCPTWLGSECHSKSKCIYTVYNYKKLRKKYNYKRAQKLADHLKFISGAISQSRIVYMSDVLNLYVYFLVTQ